MLAGGNVPGPRPPHPPGPVASDHPGFMMTSPGFEDAASQ